MDWTKSFRIQQQGRHGQGNDRRRATRPVRLSGAEKTGLRAAFKLHSEEESGKVFITPYDVPLVIMELGWSVEEFSGSENLDVCVEQLRPLFPSDELSFDDFADGFSRMIVRQVLDPVFDSDGYGTDESLEFEQEAAKESAQTEGGGFLASDDDDDDDGGFMASEDDDGGFMAEEDEPEEGGVVDEPEEEKSVPKAPKKPTADAKQAFSWFTKKETITIHDLRRISKLVKDNASDKDFRDMMEVAGGKVDIQAFETLLDKL